MGVHSIITAFYFKPGSAHVCLLSIILPCEKVHLMYYIKNGRAQGTDTGVRASVDVNFFMRCTIQSLKATTGKNEPRPAKAPASCPTEHTIAQILKAQVLSGRSIAARL